MREGWEEPYAIDPTDPFYMTREEKQEYLDKEASHYEGVEELPCEFQGQFCPWIL